MKVARVGVIAAAIIAVTTVAWAQKTDFSGTWTLDPEASGMQAGAGGGGRGGGGGALGMGGSIKQTADTLTIERMAGENKITLTYKLDGSESKNSMMGRGGQAVESTSVAKWDGAKLVITSKQPGQDGAMVETIQTWSLAGTVLTVEGTGGRGPTKRVYKKG